MEDKKETNTKTEWLRCRASVLYYTYNYCQILSADEESWIPFRPWKPQVEFLKELTTNKRMVLLKARQNGFTTCALLYLSWRFCFYPVATIGLFSKGEDEAIELLDRMRKLYNRLPGWIQAKSLVADNAHLMELSTGSWCRAFSTKKGESYSLKLILFDEFDRFDYADTLMKNVKPAADSANAQIIVGSIADKDRPNTVFKNMFRGAQQKKNEWTPVFWSWNFRPDRTQQWYDRILNDALVRHAGDMAGAMDEINQQYPATAEDALSPRSQNKRIPYLHLKAIYEERQPLDDPNAPAIPGLKIYEIPNPDYTYVWGADPAEGLDAGDDSSMDVLCVDTGRQVATLRGKFEPKKVFPSHIFTVATYYNEATGHCERNNHGHSVIGLLTELIAGTTLCKIKVLNYPQDGRPGWLSSERGKVLLYDTSAQMIKDKEVIIHDGVTVFQLQDVEINTLRAAEGNHDDAADSFSLACVAFLGKPVGFSMFRL